MGVSGIIGLNRLGLDLGPGCEQLSLSGMLNIPCDAWKLDGLALEYLHRIPRVVDLRLLNVFISLKFYDFLMWIILSFGFTIPFSK